MAHQVFPGPSASQGPASRAKREWRVQGGHQGAEAHQERASLDPRETKGCRERLAPQENEELENLELRGNRDLQEYRVCRGCQERTEPLDRRVSQELSASGGQRGRRGLARRVKRVTKAREE